MSFRDTWQSGAGEIRFTVARNSLGGHERGPLGTAPSAFVASNNHATLT